MSLDVQKIKDLVRQVAQDEIISRFKKANVSRKQDGSLVTDADVAVQQKILNGLKEIFPNAGYLARARSARGGRFWARQQVW